MKDFLKFTPHALIIAILAGLMQLIDLQTGNYFYAWIGFAAWACYFLAGCTPKGAAKVIGCWVAGVIASIAIIELGTYLTGVSGNASIGFPVAVGFIAFFVILFEKVPALDMIPAWFIGAACYFATTSTGAITNGTHADFAKVVLISCVVGQVFGYVTVWARTAYGNLVATDEEKAKASE